MSHELKLFGIPEFAPVVHSSAVVPHPFDHVVHQQPNIQPKLNQLMLF